MSSKSLSNCFIIYTCMSADHVSLCLIEDDAHAKTHRKSEQFNQWDSVIFREMTWASLKEFFIFYEWSRSFNRDKHNVISFPLLWAVGSCVTCPPNPKVFSHFIRSNSVFHKRTMGNTGEEKVSLFYRICWCAARRPWEQAESGPGNSLHRVFGWMRCLSCKAKRMGGGK